MDDGRKSGAEPAPAARTALPVVIGVVVVFVILVVVVWSTGVLDEDTSASDAEIVVAMLTLLGGLIASAFTLVGVLLKHSIERHSARLATEVEHRLRLETSIKAVELLTMPDGKPAPSARQAGALYVLASDPLEQLDLAVALLDEHWGDGMLSSKAAMWVVDRALTTADPDIQAAAARTLLTHAQLLTSADGATLEWPSCASLRWPVESDYFAQDALLDALIEALASHEADEWSATVVNGVIAQFDLIRTLEGTRPEHRAGAILALEVLLDWRLRADPLAGLQLPRGSLAVKILRDEIAPLIDDASNEVPQGTSARIERLRGRTERAGRGETPRRAG